MRVLALIACGAAVLASCGSSGASDASIPPIAAEDVEPATPSAPPPAATTEPTSSIDESIVAWPDEPPDPSSEQELAQATLRWAIDQTTSRSATRYAQQVRITGADGQTERMLSWSGAFDDVRFSGSAAHEIDGDDSAVARIVDGIEWAVVGIDGEEQWIGGVQAVPPTVAASAYEFVSVDALLDAVANAVSEVISIETDGDSTRWSVQGPGRPLIALFRGAVAIPPVAVEDATDAPLVVEMTIDGDGYVVELSVDATSYLAGATDPADDDAISRSATTTIEIAEPAEAIIAEPPCLEPVLSDVPAYGPALLCPEEVLGGQAEAPADDDGRGSGPRGIRQPADG